MSNTGNVANLKNKLNTQNSNLKALVDNKFERGTEAGILMMENEKLKSNIEILN